MEYRKGIVFILIAVNMILSMYLIYNDFSGTEGYCLTGKGCQLVKNSEYNTLFGIENNLLGLTVFTFALLIYLLEYSKIIGKKWFVGLMAICSVFALRFLYLQFFVIKAVCSTCFVIDIVSLVLLGVSIYNFKK